MLFFLSFDIGYVLILNEYLGMVACCDLVSSPQLKMSTDRTETGSWQLLNTYSFVTSKPKKMVQLDQANYFRRNLFSFAQMERPYFVGPLIRDLAKNVC